MDEEKTPVSEEVLEHIRKHDYDGQGRSQLADGYDSSDAIGIVVLLIIVGGIALGLLLWRFWG